MSNAFAVVWLALVVMAILVGLGVWISIAPWGFLQFLAFLGAALAILGFFGLTIWALTKVGL